MARDSSGIQTYTIKTFLSVFLKVLFVMLLITYMFDTIDLIRRASEKDHVQILVLLKIALLKLPDVGQKLIVFSVLFSSMITFWKMTKTYELIVARSFGLSMKQIILPIVMVVFFIGVIRVAVIQHYSSVMLKNYNEAKTVHLSSKRSKIKLSSGGFWFKDSNNLQKWIVNANSVQDKQLQDVKVFYFDLNNTFIKRLDAKTGELQNNNLVLSEVYENSGEFDSKYFETKSISSKLAPKDLEEIMIQDPQISVWDMPYYIKTVKALGLDSKPIESSFISLLCTPLLYIAMVLLAGSFACSMPRKGNNVKIIISGIIISFMVFLLNEIVLAFGMGGKISPIFAATIPTIISFLLGIIILIKKEEGF